MASPLRNGKMKRPTWRSSALTRTATGSRCTGRRCAPGNADSVAGPWNGSLDEEYRASFDAAIRFSNGGDPTAHGFRVDVPSPDIDQDGIAALFVASLGLLMTESVELSNVKTFAEPSGGMQRGPTNTPVLG